MARLNMWRVTSTLFSLLMRDMDDRGNRAERFLKTFSMTETEKAVVDDLLERLIDRRSLKA